MTRTPRRMVDRFPWIWASICFALLIAVAALTLALTSALRSADASRSAKSTSDCINAVIGTRAGPTAKDNQAHIDFAKAQQAFADSVRTLVITANGTAAQQAEAGRAFQVEINAYLGEVTDYVATLVADQKLRDQYPLGLC